MALVPVTENEPVSSSCCRIFYETSINGLTVRRMIFKNVKRLSPQTGLLENRPFLGENGRFLAAKEIKPDQKIQTDKIEIENQSRRRRSSSNLGLVTYKTLPHYYRVLDKLYVAKLPPTISAMVNSNLLATVSLFDSATTKIILATKTHNDKKHSMQVVIKKEPSYEEILTDSIINELPRCRSQSANTSGSKTIGSKDFSPVSDRKKLQNLQKESSEYVTLIKHKNINFVPPKSSKDHKRKSSILVTTKKCTKERKLSEKLKWSHRDLEQKRQMLIKEYEEYRKKLSYLETEINE